MRELFQISPKGEQPVTLSLGVSRVEDSVIGEIGLVTLHVGLHEGDAPTYTSNLYPRQARALAHALMAAAELANLPPGA